MFNLLVLLLGLLATPAQAQNTTCANRPAGDSSNACANTRFASSPGNMNYTAGYPGAKSVTLQSWLDNSLVATDFAGVDPTGVTDSTTGITAALTAMGTSGKTLRFPCGTYKISGNGTAVFTLGNVRMNISADAYNCAKLETSGVGSNTDIFLHKPTTQITDQRIEHLSVTGGGGKSVYHLDSSLNTAGPMYDTIFENLDWYDISGTAPSFVFETSGTWASPTTPGGAIAYSTIRNVNMYGVKCTRCGDAVYMLSNIVSSKTTRANVTNVSGSGTVVTVTAANNFSPGQTVILNGVVPNNYNIAYSVSTASSTQFTAASTQTGAFVSPGYAYYTTPGTAIGFEMDYVAGAASGTFWGNIISSPKAMKFHSGAGLNISGNEIEGAEPGIVSPDALVDFTGDNGVVYGAIVQQNSIVALATSNASVDLIYADKIDSLIVSGNQNLSLYQHGGYHVRTTANAATAVPYIGRDNRFITIVGYIQTPYIFNASGINFGCQGASGNSANTVLHGDSTYGCGAFGAVALGDLASLTANSVIGNATGSSAVPTALALPTCISGAGALSWNGGFSCNTGTFATVKGTTVLLSGAAAPTQSTCGTGPSIDSGSTNNSGKFTIGTGATACTLTFANAYPTNAYCTVTPMAAPAAIGNVPYVSAQSKTAFTVSGGTASASYTYSCGGN